MAEDTKITPSNFKLILLALLPFMALMFMGVLFSSTRSVNLLPPQVDIAATAQLLQLRQRQGELEVRAQERARAIQAQISQNRQMLETLQDSGRSEQAQLETYLENLQAQVDQVQAEIEAAEVKGRALEQAIQADDAQYQADLLALETELQQTEEQLRLEVEAASTRLQVISNPTETPPVPPSAPSIEDNPGGDDKPGKPQGDHDHDEGEEEEEGEGEEEPDPD